MCMYIHIYVKNKKEIISKEKEGKYQGSEQNTKRAELKKKSNRNNKIKEKILSPRKEVCVFSCQLSIWFPVSLTCKRLDPLQSTVPSSSNSNNSESYILHITSG